MILTPIKDRPGYFSLVDESGRSTAIGYLEVDYIPGATRHGDIRFVIVEPQDDAYQNVLEMAAEQRAA